MTQYAAQFNGHHVLIGWANAWDDKRKRWQQILLSLSENRNSDPQYATPSREILNIATVGMPGSGKSRLIEANLLCWQHSAVVVDLKGSLYESTANYRASVGDVVVLDVRYGSGSRINPVALVRPSTRRALAVELVTQGERATGSDRFWSNAAANAWLACWYAADDVQTPHIPYAVELLSKDLVSFLNYMFVYHRNNQKVMRLIQGFTGEPLTKKFLERLVEFGPSKLLGNKWGSVEESVTVFSEDENMLNIFSGNEINPARMFKRPTTVYIIADENNTPVFQAFVRMVMRALGDSLIDAGDKLSFSQRRPILFMFDEFGAARVNNARTWLNTMRSRGIVLWIFAQSLAQLPSETKGDYRAERENSIHHWIMFAPAYGDAETGKFISQMSGKTTIAVASSESQSQNYSNPNSFNVSKSSSYKERYNVEPEDIDRWAINQAAVSIRPNGRARSFYGQVTICSAENSGLADRRGPAAAYLALPPYEPCSFPDPPLPGEEDDQEEAEQRHDQRTRRGPASARSQPRPAPMFDPLSDDQEQERERQEPPAALLDDFQPPADDQEEQHQEPQAGQLATINPEGWAALDEVQQDAPPYDYRLDPSPAAQIRPGNIYGDAERAEQQQASERRAARERRDLWDDMQDDEE